MLCKYIVKAKMEIIKNSGISIIVPFLNESDGIERFCETIDQYVLKLSFKVELVFVDDGSTDNTVELIEKHVFSNIEKIQIIRFSKNFGSHAAIRAGFQYATFEICTWLGADLQEPLEFLQMSYDKIKNGYDVVYVDKHTVGVSGSNRLFSKTYSWLMRKYAVSNYSSGGTSVIVGNWKIKKLLNENVESNSSVVLQILDAGFRNCTISLDFHERSAGVSKWTLQKKIKLFIDSFVAFSFMPIRLVSIVGCLMFFVGIILAADVIITHFLNPTAPAGYPTLAGILFLGFGVTNISLGIIAEYLWRTYDAARKRPVYIVSDVIDMSKCDQMDEEKRK